jgi:hypothetical protein
MANLYLYPGWGTTVKGPLRQPAPTIVGGPDGRSGMLAFAVDLADIGNFLEFVAGTDEIVPTPGGGSITRRVPLLHPDDSGMFVDSYDGEMFGTAGKNLWTPGLSIHTEQFTHVRLRMLFRTLPIAIGGDQPYYTIASETSSTMETIPGNSFVTESGRRLTGDGGLPIPCTSLIVTTYLSPTPVSYTLARLSGQVNSTDVDFGIYGTFPAGTLRFDGVRQDIAVGSSGSTNAKSFILKHRDIEWNKVLNDRGEWEFAYSVGNGLPKYRSTDLNILKSA